MANSKVNVSLINGSNSEKVKVVAAVIVDPDTGLPSSSSSGTSTATVTPTLTQTTTAGSVASGAKMISIKNLGSAAVTVAGGSLPAGETITFSTVYGTLGAVAYEAGTLLIAVQR